MLIFTSKGDSPFIERKKMKNIEFKIAISTNADISAERIAELFKAIVAAGMEDAQKTFWSGEGNVEEAELATSLTISSPVIIGTETNVEVRHWDCYGESSPNTHQFDITDQRKTNGQVFASLGALEGHLDDMIAVTMEVNSNPLNGVDHVPCVHVHFDDSNIAFSLFKINDEILLSPENGVFVNAEQHNINGRSESVYIIS